MRLSSILPFLLLVCFSPVVTASLIVLSPNRTETLSGVTVRDGSAVQYNTVTQAAALFLDELIVFPTNEKIDALHVLSPDVVLFSTARNVTLDGTTFTDGDVIRYVISTGAATEFFDEGLFAANEDVDAVSIASDGDILLSAEDAASLAGVSFANGDIVKYDIANNIASVFMEESLVFTANENVDGFHLLPNGDFLISITGPGAINGQSFTDGDVVNYDPISEIATIVFDEDDFQSGAEVTAVAVPETMINLIGCAVLLLVSWRFTGRVRQ